MKTVDHIAAMAPYALADFSVPDAVKLVSLAQNESLRPPSPRSFEAADLANQSSAEYPDPDYPELRRVIADLHHIDPSTILCGAGSMELITSIAQAYAGPDAEVLTSEFGYALFRNAAEKVAAPFCLSAEPDHKVSIDSMLAMVTEKTRLCFIANPGNPTGTILANSEIRRLRTSLPGPVMLVVDEAYGEFSDANEAPLFDLAEQGDTIILRTLSKAYGLAAARVGWGVFPKDAAEQVRKLIIPSSISKISAAMASAALTDQDYMWETCRQTEILRCKLIENVRQCGLACRDSHTNFILVEFSDIESTQSADRALRQVGLVARGMAGYGLANCLRITIASQDKMELAAATLEFWAQENLT